MKKFVRGKISRLFSMALIVMFMLPSLLLPLTTRGQAAVGGHLNVLFMPLELTNADAPPNLSARILQDLQIALAKREGVQVTELQKTSPIMKRALDAVGEDDKQLLLDKFGEAANAKLSPDSRKNAAGYLVRVLGVDAIVYGSVDKYEFTTKPDKNQTYIKVTLSKVTVNEDGTAGLTPLTVIGKSWPRPDGKGEQTTHDLEAVQMLAQNLAAQLTGAKIKEEPRNTHWWQFFGNRSRSPQEVSNYPPEDGRSKQSGKSWIVLALLAALGVAVLAGGRGGDDGGVPPPPTDYGTGYAYPENDGDIRLEISKPSNWSSVAGFEIWREALNEARGQTKAGSRTRSTRALGYISTTERDFATVQGNKVILIDSTASYGYIYQYRVVVVTTNNTRSNINIYNGHAPLMLLPGVGPYVPPPVERVTAPANLIVGGRATLYWYMPGEPLSSPPIATYAMPSYVSGFVVQMLDENTGAWTTIASGLSNSTRQYDVPIPLANQTFKFTVRAVSSRAGLMYPLEALSPSQLDQVIAEVSSDQSYTPDAPTSVTVNAVVSGTDPDKINMRISWPASTDMLVNGYNIYRRTAGSVTSSRTSARNSRARTTRSSRNVFSMTRQSRLIGDQQLLYTVTSRATTSWTDTTLTAADYGTSFIYSVTCTGIGGAESAQTDGQVTINPVAPTPAPVLNIIPNPTDPRLTAFQLQWSLPTDPTIYGYVISRAQSVGQGRATRGITGSHGGKFPPLGSGRGSRGRGVVLLRPSRIVRAPFDEVYRTSRRTETTYTDTDLVDGTTYSYIIQYLYLGSADGGPQSGEVSQTYDLLPNDVTDLALTEPVAGTRHLSWTAPTTNVDDSPLTDGQAFRIYRSTTLAKLPDPNPTVTAATLQASFTLFATTPDWTTTTYNDTSTIPLRTNVSYAVVSLDAANQLSPGPYLVVQLIKLPNPKRIDLTPASITAPAAGPAQLLTATVYGTDDLPLPYTSVDVVITPDTAGLIALDQLTAPRVTQLTLTTNENGTATFYWFPPDPQGAAETGQITATITGTSFFDITSLTIQLAPPPLYTPVDAVAVAVSTQTMVHPTRIYYSEDPDDQLGPGTAIETVLFISGIDDQGNPADFSRVRLRTTLGGFRLPRANEQIIQLGDQVVSADRKTITGTLNKDGLMEVYFTGEPDDNTTEPIDIPAPEQLGLPDITAQDAYEGDDIDVDDTNLPLLIGTPYRIALNLVPKPRPDWPAQTDQYPVTFQEDTNDVIALVTDIRGETVLTGMPIYFTQTWRKFNGPPPGPDVPLTGPYDYLGCLGYANVSGDVAGGPVGHTDDTGTVTAGFQSNHSGLYTVRAFALIHNHQDGMSILRGYNQDTTGVVINGETYCGVPPVIDGTLNLLPYLLWSDTTDTVHAATSTTIITDSTMAINKTLVGSMETNGTLHWEVLDVSRGGVVALPGDFSQSAFVKPKIVVDYKGDNAARIHFRGTDEDWKYVLQGVPFAVFPSKGDYNDWGVIDPILNGQLQRVGAVQNEDICRTTPLGNMEGLIMGFTENSEAYVLSRGEFDIIDPVYGPESYPEGYYTPGPAHPNWDGLPVPGPATVCFDNMRRTSPFSVYQLYLLEHMGPSLERPSIVEEPPRRLVVRMFYPAAVGGEEELSTPVRLADMNFKGNAGLLPKEIDIQIELKDINGNPYPNYTVEIWGYGMRRPLFLHTDSEGKAEYTYQAPDLDKFMTALDIVDTGRTSFEPGNPLFDSRNLRINIYGNKNEPSRGDWFMQYVTVERPHFLYLQGAPDDGMVLPLDATFLMMGYAENNMIDNPSDPFDGPRPVLDGFNLTFGIDKPAGDTSASVFDPATGETFAGVVSTSYKTGAGPGQAQIYVYYDKNANGKWEPGEPRSTVKNYYLGLIKPKNLAGAYDAITGQIALGWDAVPGADHYEIQYRIGAGPWTNLAQPTTNSYTYAPPPGDAITYTYQVRAVAGLVNSEWSDPVNVTYTLVLGDPANLQAVYNSATGQVELTWDRATGAQRYYVYLDPDGLAGPQPFNGTPLNPTAITTESYVYTPPAGAHTYAYRVRAWNVTYSGYAVSADLTFDLILAAPQNLSAFYNAGMVSLQWDPVPGALNYRLQENVDGNGWQQLDGILTGTSYSYTPPSGSHTIDYQVRAENGADVSDYSTPDDISYTLTLLPPSSFDAQFNNYTNEVDFNWLPATGATGYKIIWRQVGDIDFQDLATLPATPTWWSSDPPIDAAILEFRMVTLNGVDESAFSDPVYVNVPFLP